MQCMSHSKTKCGPIVVFVVQFDSIWILNYWRRMYVDPWEHLFRHMLAVC